MDESAQIKDSRDGGEGKLPIVNGISAREGSKYFVCRIYAERDGGDSPNGDGCNFTFTANDVIGLLANAHYQRVAEGYERSACNSSLMAK